MQKLKITLKDRLRRKPLPHVPNEIILQILSNVDTTTLRYHCRLVSHFFKQTSEHIIVRRILPYVPIRLQNHFSWGFRPFAWREQFLPEPCGAVDLAMIPRKKKKARLNHRQETSARVSYEAVPSLRFSMLRLEPGDSLSTNEDPEEWDESMVKATINAISTPESFKYSQLPKATRVAIEEPLVLDNGLKLYPEKVPGLCLVFWKLGFQRERSPGPRVRGRWSDRFYVKQEEYSLWYGLVERYLQCLEAQMIRRRVYSRIRAVTPWWISKRDWSEKVLLPFVL
ncbi:hypothetical protein K491DRAFT_723077 [Lophiostoma macrostomum CBS 122681]|uniref:Uncharacterized protein n=1 Tax=Lophiostoma macrostomum CBS 122681 TaxID=1314788 RepID=A0A6A6SJ77_9PLEO|nr:hypothetical protein K491DRAFT_723077 [Lophiostoma macrostomum CBS 122681]